jgi:uncharacterized protein
LQQRETTLSQAGNRVLRLNVGFILKEGVGFSRDFAFDEAEVEVADDLPVHALRGSMNFTRTPQGLYGQGRLQATLTTECARCLTPFEQAVSSRISELFYYPPENAPEGAAKVGDDVHVDLAPLVREDIFLGIPMHALCRPDCKGLCPNCGQNWNDGPCDCEAERRDPRWAALNQLLKESRHS